MCVTFLLGYCIAYPYSLGLHATYTLQCHFDDGRTLPGSGRAHNVAGIQRARSFATTAAAAHAAHVIDRATAAKAARGTPQAFLAQAVFALPHLAEDFQVLGKRGAQQQAVQLLLCSPAPLVEAVLELKDDLARPRGGGAAGSLGPEDVLTRIRMAIRDHALPCLRSTDWKGSKKPEHVGLIYVILLTLAACDIYRECTRVLVKGEAVSQMFHSLLGDGYKIALSQVSHAPCLALGYRYVCAHIPSILSDLRPLYAARGRRKGRRASHCSVRGPGAARRNERRTISSCFRARYTFRQRCYLGVYSRDVKKAGEGCCLHPPWTSDSRTPITRSVAPRC